MKKSLIAGASALALGLAVIPAAGVFAADVTEITDTVKVTIDPTCSFNTTNSASASNTEFSATVLNGAEAAFNNSGAHKFNVTCNNNDGYTVTATPTNLIGTKPATGDKNNIPYTTSYSASGEDGMWTATIAGDEGATITSPVPAIDAASHIVVTEDGATANTTFTTTYKVYVGTETPADTYTGTMAY